MSLGFDYKVRHLTDVTPSDPYYTRWRQLSLGPYATRLPPLAGRMDNLAMRGVSINDYFAKLVRGWGSPAEGLKEIVVASRITQSVGLLARRNAFLVDSSGLSLTSGGLGGYNERRHGSLAQG